MFRHGVAILREDSRRKTTSPTNQTKYFYILLTVHPNKMTVFYTNLMLKFFILVHLLHSSTCFEHYCAHLQEDNCINTASVIVTLNSHPKTVTIPDAVLIQLSY